MLSLQSAHYVLVIYDYDYYKQTKQNIIKTIHGPFLSVRDANNFRVTEYLRKLDVKGMSFSIHPLKNWQEDDISNCYTVPTTM